MQTPQAPEVLPAAAPDGARQRRAAARLRPLAAASAEVLVLHEIYASVQGESTWAGRPCTFVRTTGCPLRCRWCDTPHAFTQGMPWRRDAVLERVAALGLPLVELTGGEPLAQPGTLPLLAALCDRGHTVLLETSGALDIGAVDPRVVRIVDLKAPGSGEVGANRLANLPLLRPSDEVKFVLDGRADYDWACQMVREHGLAKRCEVLFSAVHGRLPLAELAAWMVADRLPVRLQAQLHKFIWDAAARGV